MSSLVLTSAVSAPVAIAGAGEHASYRFLEFFTARIRNPHTRRSYGRAVGDFLGDLLLEYGVLDAQLVVSLPRQASHWRVVDWQAGQEPGDCVDELRALNPDLGWPFPLEQAYLDVHPLPGLPASSLVIAAERSVVDAWVEVFAIAGGTLQHLLPSQPLELHLY
jgi:hypothetical protein